MFAIQRNSLFHTLLQSVFCPGRILTTFTSAVFFHQFENVLNSAPNICICFMIIFIIVISQCLYYTNLLTVKMPEWGGPDPSSRRLSLFHLSALHCRLVHCRVVYFRVVHCTAGLCTAVQSRHHCSTMQCRVMQWSSGNCGTKQCSILVTECNWWGVCAKPGVTQHPIIQTLYIVHSTLYIVHCTLYTITYTLYAKYIVQQSQHTIHCIYVQWKL